jgi:hypothetical protein
VLATTQQYYTNKKKWNPMYDRYRFDEKCVKVFNQIFENSNVLVVLSSDWKENYTIEHLNRIFAWNGVKITIVDKTPNLWKVKFTNLQQLEECRSAEIQQYIDEHEIERYVIIDDLDLSPWFPENFVRTPRANEGIKQSGLKNKIINLLQ